MVRPENDDTVTRPDPVKVRVPPTLCSWGAVTFVTSAHGPTVIPPLTVTTDCRSDATWTSVMMLDTMLIFSTTVTPPALAMAFAMSVAVEVWRGRCVSAVTAGMLFAQDCGVDQLE